MSDIQPSIRVTQQVLAAAVSDGDLEAAILW
jgi:hypothetical protein